MKPVVTLLLVLFAPAALCVQFYQVNTTTKASAFAVNIVKDASYQELVYVLWLKRGVCRQPVLRGHTSTHLLQRHASHIHTGSRLVPMNTLLNTNCLLTGIGMMSQCFHWHTTTTASVEIIKSPTPQALCKRHQLLLHHSQPASASGT